MALPGFYDPFGRPTGDGVLKVIATFGAIMVIGLFVVLFIGTTTGNATGRTHQVAQEQADKFLRAVPGAHAQCVEIDSDGDGYVSCPYTTPDGNVHALECAGSFNMNTGCRVPKAVLTPNFYPR